MAVEQQEASEAARKAILAIGEREGFAPVILDDRTVETAFGWLFYYDSREFAERRAPGAALIGNPPVVVDRQSGQVLETGTEWPLFVYLAPFLRGGEAAAGG